MTRAHPDDRARRHRLRGRRAAAPDRRPSAACSSRASCRTASRASRSRKRFRIWRARIPATRVQVAGGDRAADRGATRSALFSAAPHGVSAALIDSLLTRAAARGYAAARRRHLRGLPLLLGRSVRERSTSMRTARPSASREFTCAVPEHLRELDHAARRRIRAASPPPMLLASVPLLALGLVEPPLFVAGVTGSTGSGRKPVEGTHHPLRHSDLYSYNALAHRHAPEVDGVRARGLGRRGGLRLRAAFRAVRARHSRDGAGDAEDAAGHGRASSARCASSMRGSPFVRVTRAARRASRTSSPATTRTCPPRRTGARSPSMCVVDNLNKGAAGGAVQWMNRMLGFDGNRGPHRARAGLDLT